MSCADFTSAAAIVLGIVAVVRAKRTRRHLEQLEEELRQIRQRLPPPPETMTFLTDPASAKVVIGPAVTTTTPQPQPSREPTLADSTDADSTDAGSTRAPRAAGPMEPKVGATTIGEPPVAPPPPALGQPTVNGDPFDDTPRIPTIDWEQWLGVRGAAVLGGVVLALAGVLFFKYSIEHGLISPTMRVVLGTMTGLACIVTGQWVKRSRYAMTTNALAGAGIVILYASFWAAKALYNLIPMAMAFVLMILVTTAGGVLAVRRSSMVVAVLGLAGGFLTPILLSSGSDRPIGLFGYLLLLNLGVFHVARRRCWPLLGLLSLGCTAIYEVLWVTQRMGPERLPLGLGVIAVFVVLFVAFGRLAPPEQRRTWFLGQAAAILLPLAFALYFVGNTDFGPHLYPTAFLLLLISVGAAWIAKSQDKHWLGLAVAIGDVIVPLVWLLQRELDAPLAWELVAVLLAFALVFYVAVERSRDAFTFEGPAPAAIQIALGSFICLFLAAADSAAVPIWPFVVGDVALAALLIRHGTFVNREWLHFIAAVGMAVGFAVVHLSHGDRANFPRASLYLAVLIVVASAFHGVSLLRRAEQTRRWAGHAAAAFSLMNLLPLAVAPFFEDLSPHLGLGVSLLLGATAVFAATRAGIGGWSLAATATTAVTQSIWISTAVAIEGWPEVGRVAVFWLGLSVLFFTAWPFMVSNRFRSDRWAWYGSALAGPFWFLALRSAYLEAWSPDTIGVLPVALAVISMVAILRARRLWPQSQAMHKAALVWFSAVALGFISVAIPLQLEKEWITLGGALEGTAVLVLWRRLDHPGLKYFGLALLAVVSTRLTANPYLLGYYPRSGWPVMNWLMYTYWVPTLALIGSTIILRRDELGRARAWEKALYGKGIAWGAAMSAAAGLVVFFVWINLAIADGFSAGPKLELRFDRMPARDVATSIAWAGYALAILAVGVWRNEKGLRWASLVLLMGTIVKVFLHDLGELQDLYRVMSLVGLAVSLILVSLGYQRFVFRKHPVEVA